MSVLMLWSRLVGGKRCAKVGTRPPKNRRKAYLINKKWQPFGCHFFY